MGLFQGPPGQPAPASQGRAARPGPPVSVNLPPI